MRTRPKTIQTAQQLKIYLDSETTIERHNGYNYDDITWFFKKLNDTSVGKLVNRDSRTIKGWRALVDVE